MANFSTISIDSDQIISDETLGTKEKFWIEHAGEIWLFKAARRNTGEDWSEKLAGEIANLLSIPAAQIELATHEGRPGTISKSFVNRSQGEDLVHGNEVLGGLVFEYDPDIRWGQKKHTVENIAKAIRARFPEAQEADNALGQLASYIVLDGLIGNVDRHHENWGLIAILDSSTSPPSQRFQVAPSFDHATSLGRELLEPKVLQKLVEDNGVENYIRKGRGAIYLDPEDKKGQNPLYLASRGLQDYPQYFEKPIIGLKSMPLSHILALVDRIPGDRISPNHVTFVKRFITYTYNTLCILTT